MTIFKKRLFCIVAACFMLILPFISWVSGTTKEAKADTLLYSFNGSNLFFNSAVLHANGFLIPFSGAEYVFTYTRNASFYPELSLYQKIENSSDYIKYISPKYAYPPSTSSGGYTLPNVFYGSSNVPISLALDLSQIDTRDTSDTSVGSGYGIVCRISNFEIYSSENKPVDFRLGTLGSTEGLLYWVNNPQGLIPSAAAAGDMTNNPNGDGWFDVSYTGRYGYWLFYNAANDVDFYFEYSRLPIYAMMRYYLSSPDFVPRVVRVELGSYIPSDSVLNNETFYRCIEVYNGSYCLDYISTAYNYVRYYDSNDHYFEFAIPCNLGYAYAQNNVSSVLYQSRSYYLNTSLDGYDLGYDAGLKDGQINLKNSVDLAVKEAKKQWDADLNDSISGRLDAEYEKGRQYGFQQGADTEFGFGMFMSGVLSVFDIPIFGEFSLGTLFMVVFGATMLIFILKIFAGG